MGKNQGVISLNRGIARKLTKSEIDRGYLFITKDNSFFNLYGNTLRVDVLGKRTTKKLDHYGRIFLGKEKIAIISRNKVTRISFKSQEKLLKII